MAEVLSWRAYYDGGLVFDSEHTAWTAIPTTGLLVVMLYFTTKDRDSGVRHRRIMMGNDFFYRTLDPARSPDGSGFHQTDDAAMATRDARSAQDIRPGKLVSDASYLQTVNRALLDLVEPPKLTLVQRLLNMVGL